MLPSCPPSCPPSSPPSSHRWLTFFARLRPPVCTATSRHFDKATEEYTAALSVVEGAAPRAPLIATLHADRAAAWLRLKEFDASLKDCAKAIYAQDDCKVR